MNEKERAVARLTGRLSMTGLTVGVVAGALSAFRGGETDEMVAATSGLFLALAIALPLILVLESRRQWASWRSLLNDDPLETAGLLIFTGAFGAALASAIFLIPVASFAYLIQRTGPWEILPRLYTALVWQDFSIVVAAATLAACALAFWLYRSARASPDD